MILDEPTNELSPQRRHHVWHTLRELNKAQRTTIILVTHVAIEAEKIVQRVGILRAGHLVAVGRPQELKQRISQQLRLEFFSERSAPPTLSGLPVQRIASGHWVTHLPRTQLDDVLDLLTRNHIVDFKWTCQRGRRPIHREKSRDISRTGRSSWPCFNLSRYRL